MNDAVKTKVSVIIPAYNVEKYVDRCLASIEKQTYGIENLEIILVDDASTDDTVAHLELFEKDHPEQVILIKCEQNGKLGAARNIGMNYVSGEYMMFIDSDDAIDASMIEKMVTIAEEYDCDEVECGLKEFFEDSEMFIQNDDECSYYMDLSDDSDRKRFVKGSLKTGVCGRLYKSTFIIENQLSFLEQIFYEDVHFSGIAMFLLHNYYRINETLYYYFQNTEGIIHSAYSPEKVHQETEVLDILLQELDERGMLDDILRSYYAEFEFYCIAKSFIDPLNMLLASGRSLEKFREEIQFFKEHLLELFPCASNNIYLNHGDGIFALGIWLLNADRTHTEEVFAVSGDKRIILMNTHQYINIGDHLITEASLALLKDYYPDYQILEVPASHFLLERKLLQLCISRADVIVIVGGGYLGSLWLLNGEYNVRTIVQDYPDNRIVIFPQSMYFGNDDEGASELMLSRRFYGAHKNLHMILREERSYILAQSVMPENVKTYYLPDTALYCAFEADGLQRNGMAVCLRKDKEQVCNRNVIVRYAVDIALRKNMEAVETDMLAPEVFPMSLRQQVVGIKAEEFSGYEIVITDRLHCMVYCAITGTPCVAFDNLSKKVSGVYRWIEKLPYIKVIQKESELDDAVESVLKADTQTIRPHELLSDAFETLASLVAPVDMPAEEKDDADDHGNSYVKFLDVSVGNENCNFRCEYCFVAQQRGYFNNYFTLPYDIEFLRRAFSVKRFGGRCMINLGSSGETLLSGELIPVIRMFLEEGHYVSIVTNGSVSKAFDQIVDFPERFRRRLFIKFSFHYLELKRLSLFDVFWCNVNKMKDNGVSYTLEITPCDNLIPHIPDIKEMFEQRANGAMPHLTIARNDLTGGIDILSELSIEDYIKTWGVFDSVLFDFKMSLYHRKVNEYCMAGSKAFSVNLKTGAIHQCVAHKLVGNIYDDVTEKLEFDAVGCHCKLPYCFNGHAYLTIGLCRDIEAPTYYEVRDRIDRDGAHWVTGDIKEVFLQKF